MLKDIDVVIPVCYLIEYSNNHPKTSRNSWQYFNDEPGIDIDSTIINFSYDNNSKKVLFELKPKNKT